MEPESIQDRNQRLGRRVTLAMLLIAGLTLGYALATTPWRRANDHPTTPPAQFKP